MNIVLIASYIKNENELFADEIPNIETHSPFGHLQIKYGFILTRLNILNETITEIHSLHSTNIERIKNREYVSREETLRPIVKCISLATELKILTDELISLNYLLNYYYTKNCWPSEIEIDCIGAYLNMENKKGFEAFNNHTKTIDTINDIGNAIKHSFINSEIIWKQNPSPTPKLFAIHQKRNKLNNSAKLYEISIPELITEYNAILEDIKVVFHNYYQNKHSRDSD
ncbi:MULTISPECIES: hypothetical protein [unclassified Paraflavitalea]|uniref:hypothetical protein n=1 Tax=unclassified Paraflavitalea TaxID=2798305 RepID=UPI003D34CAF3